MNKEVQVNSSIREAGDQAAEPHRLDWAIMIGRQAMTRQFCINDPQLAATAIGTHDQPGWLTQYLLAQMRYSFCLTDGKVEVWPSLDPGRAIASFDLVPEAIREHYASTISLEAWSVANDMRNEGTLLPISFNPGELVCGPDGVWYPCCELSYADYGPLLNDLLIPLRAKLERDANDVRILPQKRQQARDAWVTAGTLLTKAALLPDLEPEDVPT